MKRFILLVMLAGCLVFENAQKPEPFQDEKTGKYAIMMRTAGSSSNLFMILPMSLQMVDTPS